MHMSCIPERLHHGASESLSPELSLDSLKSQLLVFPIHSSPAVGNILWFVVALGFEEIQESHGSKPKEGGLSHCLGAVDNSRGEIERNVSGQETFFFSFYSRMILVDH